MHTHTHTHKRTHSLTHTHSLCLSLIHSNACMRRHTQTHTHTRTHTHILTHTHTRTRTHIHNDSHTHAKTHTQTHIRTHTHSLTQRSADVLIWYKPVTILLYDMHKCMCVVACLSSCSVVNVDSVRPKNSEKHETDRQQTQHSIVFVVCLYFWPACACLNAYANVCLARMADLEPARH